MADNRDIKKLLSLSSIACIRATQTHGQFLNGAKSGHMPWALCDQVEEEGAAHRFAEVRGGESEEKQPPPIYAVRQ